MTPDELESVRLALQSSIAEFERRGKSPWASSVEAEAALAILDTAEPSWTEKKIRAAFDFDRALTRTFPGLMARLKGAK